MSYTARRDPSAEKIALGIFGCGFFLYFVWLLLILAAIGTGIYLALKHFG